MDMDPHQHLTTSRANSRALARMLPRQPRPLTSLEFQDLTDRSPVKKLELGQPAMSRARNHSKRACGLIKAVGGEIDMERSK